jgi:hypothetical protein
MPVGDVVILADASRILFADDGQVDIDVATQGSIEMSDTPSGHAGTATPANVVSLFQSNSTCTRAKRIINWEALPDSVAYISGAQYTGGSPSGSRA